MRRITSTEIQYGTSLKTLSRTTLLSVLIPLLLSACSNAPEEEKKTALQSKPDTLKEAKKSVEVPHTQVQDINAQIAIQIKAANGANLYANRCASCHGKNAKKSALNASAAIAGWEPEKIRDALRGYADGSYGGKMKGVMQGQSKPLSDADIELLSNYISTL